jgi:hypothetical protein
MAFYIKLRKTFEDVGIAKYSFETDGEHHGILAINKLSGEVSLLEPLPGDGREMLFLRAAASIRKEWKDGRFPSATEWAS